MNAPPPNLWPGALVAAILLFIGGLAVLVVISTRNPEELVLRDYYAGELKHQSRLDAENRANALDPAPSWAFDASARMIVLTLPASHRTPDLAGKITLFKPDNEQLDQLLPLAPDAQGRHVIDTSNLAPGLWHFQLEWATGGTNYFLRKTELLR